MRPAPGLAPHQARYGDAHAAREIYRGVAAVDFTANTDKPGAIIATPAAFMTGCRFALKSSLSLVLRNAFADPVQSSARSLPDDFSPLKDRPDVCREFFDVLAIVSALRRQRPLDFRRIERGDYVRVDFLHDIGRGSRRANTSARSPNISVAQTRGDAA